MKVPPIVPRTRSRVAQMGITRASDNMETNPVREMSFGQFVDRKAGKLSLRAIYKSPVDLNDLFARRLSSAHEVMLEDCIRVKRLGEAQYLTCTKLLIIKSNIFVQNVIFSLSVSHVSHNHINRLFCYIDFFR